MKAVLILVTGLLAMGQTVAKDAPAWFDAAIKQENPNELAYFVTVESDCETTKEQAKAIVEDVLVRSRIKPLDGFLWFIRNLYLGVALNCLPRGPNNPVFEVSAYFGNYSDNPKIIYDRNFSIFGIGPRESIEEALKEITEVAVAAYLKANFDLDRGDTATAISGPKAGFHAP